MLDGHLLEDSIDREVNSFLKILLGTFQRIDSLFELHDLNVLKVVLAVGLPKQVLFSLYPSVLTSQLVEVLFRLLDLVLEVLPRIVLALQFCFEVSHFPGLEFLLTFQL